jgi:hypothetical protein
LEFILSPDFFFWEESPDFLVHKGQRVIMERRADMAFQGFSSVFFLNQSQKLCLVSLAKEF